jgi:hypothetical protein
MHQYNVGAPFERIAIALPKERPRKLIPPHRYDYMKWPEAYSIPNQEASAVA